MGFGRLVVNSLFTSVIIVLFVTSGLIVNALWTIILPLWFAGRRDLYRACCKHITTAWFRSKFHGHASAMDHLTTCSVIIFIPLVWGKCEFKVYSDDETEKYAGKEVGICIANHRYTNDWILDFIAAEQYRNVFKFGPWRIVHFDCLFKRSLWWSFWPFSKLALLTVHFGDTWTS